MFIAQPSPGQMVDSWTVNGTDRLLHMGNSGFYRVLKEDSDLRFDYTEKIAGRLELKFDSSKIRCTKLYDKTPIAPGQREKGDSLVFRAINGTAVQWKINDKPYYQGKQHLVLFIKQQLGNVNSITISYE